MGRHMSGADPGLTVPQGTYRHLARWLHSTAPARDALLDLILRGSVLLGCPAPFLLVAPPLAVLGLMFLEALGRTQTFSGALGLTLATGVGAYGVARLLHGCGLTTAALARLATEREAPAAPSGRLRIEDVRVDLVREGPEPALVVAVQVATPGVRVGERFRVELRLAQRDGRPLMAADPAYAGPDGAVLVKADSGLVEENDDLTVGLGLVLPLGAIGLEPGSIWLHASGRIKAFLGPLPEAEHELILDLPVPGGTPAPPEPGKAARVLKVAHLLR